MKSYISSASERLTRNDIKLEGKPAGEFRKVAVYPEVGFQSVIGFGGAFTEAAGYVFSQMGPGSRERLLDLYFGPGSSGYTLCRTHIQSCDFALGNYAYIDDPDDRELRTFSLDRDRKYLLPLIKAAGEREPGLSLLASPWSPPGFMKTSGQMNRGGTLRPEYRRMWADMLVRYLREYREMGVRVDRITVQNEPMAVQKWDSCIWTGTEEAEFVRDLLRPVMDAAGLEDVKVLIWDHNKDIIVERVRESLSVPGAAEKVGGVAFHWYTGDHFEALRHVRDAWPDKELIFTEGCVEYSREKGATELDHAERYAHAMIGDMLAGANGMIDWNIYLDMRGGPNHVGNYCDAPVMCDPQRDTFRVNLSYWYIGHMTRFVRPGARRILVSSYSPDLECCGFKNTDGTVAVICLNRTGRNVPYALSVGGRSVRTVQKAHTIVTYVTEAGKDEA